MDKMIPCTIPARWLTTISLLCILVLRPAILFPKQVDAFFLSNTRSMHPPLSHNALQAAKGFGAASSSNKKKRPPSQKQILKKLKQSYGGTSPEEIARGTQKRIDNAIAHLAPPIPMALQIYQQLTKWNLRLDSMSVLDQAKIPVEEMEGAKRAQAELDRLMDEHDFTTRDLHNILQQATWDASADAKAARSVTGEMPADIARKVQTGCDIAVQSALDLAGAPDARILDVGCGFGVLVPFLRKAGWKNMKNLHGIDLSPEMIRNASELYPDCSFQSGDFYAYDPGFAFQSIFFCSSLHDMPNMMEATLPKAGDLLVPGGKLVLLHPQGASHVQGQVHSNPTMVPRGLPTVTELESMKGFRLIQAPAAPKSREEEKDGYLAVLERVED